MGLYVLSLTYAAWYVHAAALPPRQPLPDFFKRR